MPHPGVASIRLATVAFLDTPVQHDSVDSETTRVFLAKATVKHRPFSSYEDGEGRRVGRPYKLFIASPERGEYGRVRIDPEITSVTRGKDVRLMCDDEKPSGALLLEGRGAGGADGQQSRYKDDRMVSQSSRLTFLRFSCAPTMPDQSGVRQE